MIRILKKGDILLILIIMILSFLPLLFIKKDFNNNSARIIVSQDSKIISKFELNEGNNSIYIDFEFKVEGKIYKGTLETKDSKVRLLRLPEEVVPRSIHADMSWISDDKKIIVALPVKLVVSIESIDKQSDVDSIAT